MAYRAARVRPISLSEGEGALWARVWMKLANWKRHCYRGIEKVELHCLLSVLTLQAKAVVQIEAGNNLRQCLRKVT